MDQDDSKQTQHGSDAGRYLRFGAMIATSTVTMYAISYLNTFAIEHVRFSELRVYMALLMGSAMAVIMLGFMWGMHRRTVVNIGIIVAALAIGGSALFLARSQVLVEDVNYMKGMTPHHSIAILTSERAQISDLRVRELADEIIQAQRREIAEMEWLIADIEENGPATTSSAADARPVPSFEASP